MIFILQNLKSFDGIIGDDTLKELGAIINRKDDTLTIGDVVLPLKHRISKQVNNLEKTLYEPEVEEIIKNTRTFSDQYPTVEQ